MSKYSILKRNQLRAGFFLRAIDKDKITDTQHTYKFPRYISYIHDHHRQ